MQWRLHGGASAEQWAKFEQFIASHPQPIASASAADGSVVALADKDGRVRLWHNFTAARLPDLRPPDGKLRRRARSDDTKLRRRGRSDDSLALSADGLAFSDDGHALALSAGNTNVVSVWDTATGTNRFRLPPRADVITDLVFSPDGRTLAVPGDDTTVQLRDARTGELAATLAGHDVAVTAIAFSPDGRTLATLGGHWTKLWHLPTRREVGTLLTGGDRLAFSPDGTLLLLAHWSGQARLLRAPQAEGTRPLP